MGAFCKAFRDEHFRIVWANENDQFAIRTYSASFPETKLYEESIERLSVVANRLPPVDVITAGFPCQPFSMAGNKGGFEDRRGRLFFEVTRLLQEFGKDRPKIVVFENVSYLLAHRQGKTFAAMVQEIQRAGYWFSPSRNAALLNTRVHTDIPQNRERLYFVALSWDHFDTNDFRFPEPVEEVRDYREFLDLQSRADDWCYFPEDSKWGQMFAESMDAGDPDAVYHLRRHYVREIKGLAVPTLTAHMGDGGHNVPVIRDNWGIRKLTQRECLRLQGMSESEFVFPDGVSRSQQYKQIGNAVTVPLVRKLAAECRRLLGKRAR